MPLVSFILYPLGAFGGGRLCAGLHSHQAGRWVPQEEQGLGWCCQVISFFLTVHLLSQYTFIRVYATRRMRAGKGKLRNRRHVQKLGPLVIYDQDQGVTKAFRNIPGVDVIQVDNSCTYNRFQRMGGLKVTNISFHRWTTWTCWNLPQAVTAKDGQHRPLRPAQVWGHQGSSACPQPQGVQGCGVRTNPDHSVHASAEPLRWRRTRSWPRRRTSGPR